MEKPTKQCTRCKKLMAPNQAFCCPRPCAHCGEALPLGAGDNRKYCGDECRIAEYRERHPKPHRHCLDCGNKLSSKQRQLCRSCRVKRQKAKEKREPMPSPVPPEQPVIWYGFRYIWKPEHPRALRGRIREDENVMEQLLGRFLRPDETIHHRDMNKLNNNPKNLMLCKKRVHRQIRREILDRLHDFIERRNLVEHFLDFLEQEVYVGSGGSVLREPDPPDPLSRGMYAVRSQPSRQSMPNVAGSSAGKSSRWSDLLPLG